MTFPEPILQAEYVSLGTFRKSGKEVRTPVWFCRHGNALYVFSEGNAGKVKRLRNSPKSQIAPCTYNGTIVGEWMPTSGYLVDSEEEIQAAYKAFDQKYGWKVKIFNFFSKLGGKYNKRAMLRIEPAEGED